MTGFLGLGLVFVGAMGGLMMHITQSIPYRWPGGQCQRHEDPEGFWLYMTIFKAMAAVGAGLFAIHLIMGS